MSSEIEFRHVALRFSGELAVEVFAQQLSAETTRYMTRHENLYLVFVESGSSNTFTRRVINGRESEVVARSWAMAMLGDEYQVMRKVCEWAVDALGGMIRLRGRGIEPENYIRHYRRVLEQATHPEKSQRILDGVQLRFNVDGFDAADHPWLAHAAAAGRLTTSQEKHFISFNGQQSTHADVAALALLADSQRKSTTWFYPCSALTARLDAQAKQTVIWSKVRAHGLAA